MIKCSSCGQEVAEEKNFCPNCGKSLEEEKAILKNENQEFACPKCGSRFKGKPKFCDNCGLEFNWPEGNFDSIPVKVTEPFSKPARAKATEQGKARAKKESPSDFGVFDIVKNSLLILVSLLLVIATWLPFCKVGGMTSIGASVNLGVEFWFRDLWQNASPAPWYVYIGFVLFILAVISVLSFGTISIVKSIKGIIKRSDEKPFGFALGAVTVSSLYFVYSLAMLFTSVSSMGVSVGTTLGSGGVLAFIAAILLVATYVAERIFKFAKDKEGSVVGLVLGSITSIALLVGLFTSFNAGHLVQGLSSASVFMLNTQVPPLYDITIVMFAFEFVFVFIAMVAFCYAFVVSLKIDEGDKRKRILIALTSITLAASIGYLVFAILVNVNLDLDYKVNELSIGAGPIIGVIASFVAFGCSVANKLIKKLN